MSSMIREPLSCEDEGFFGPDSIFWRTNGPTIIPALYYAGAMFVLNPWNAEIGLQNTSLLTSPFRRVVLTSEYMYAVCFGDRATARHAAGVVNRIHDHVTGTWAPTGERVHSASEPHNLLWFLTCFSQGMLEAYDAYGPRPLTTEERDHFWREENTIIGELNRIPDSMMQKSQAEVDDYLEAQRPNLATIGPAQNVVNAVLFPKVTSGGLSGATAVPVRALAAAGAALLPDYAMELYGQKPYSRAKKFAIRAANRPFYAAAAATPGVRDILPLAISGPCRTLMLRARAGARSGNYDLPSGIHAVAQAAPRSA